MCKKINIRCSLVILLIFCLIPDLFPQGTDVNKGKQTAFYIGLNTGYSQTQIVNSGFLFNTDLKSNPEYSYMGSLEFGYIFSKFLNISAGIGYCPYKTEFILGKYQSDFYTFDSEKDFYNRQVTGTDITEIQKVAYIYFPFSFEFNIPFNPKISFFLHMGINLSSPVQKEYSSSGTFTFKGYYPGYNVLLQDLPQYGFPTNSEYGYDGDLVLKPLVTEFDFGAGIHYLVKNKFQFGVGAFYNFSLSGISDYSTIFNYQLSKDSEHINSIMEGSNEATTKAIGLRLSFRYYLKK